MKPIVTRSAMETREAGRNLGRTLKNGDVVALTGKLGAGKTVFVQGVAEAMGIESPVTSPTFTIISEYEGRMPLYHMDLYRIGSPDEFTWLGVEEMIEGSGVCIVEWSERAGSELPDRTIRVDIAIEADGTRVITIVRPREAAA